MKENEWDLVFNGFIDMDPIEQELTGFINYVKNDLKDDLKKVYPTMLVVAQDEEQATLFAQGVANILKKEGLISYYVNRPSFLWDKPISDNFDCVLVNDFDDKSVDKNSLDIISKRIVRSPFNDRLNMVTIFYTTKERAEQYKAFYKEDYYKLFESRTTLKPYTIQNIMAGAHYYFDEWQRLGEIKLKDDFYPALDQWIDTVYGRADKKGKDFVLGLKDRLIKQSKILGEPYVFGANTIPMYWRREASSVVKNEMLEDKTLLWSADLDSFFKQISMSSNHNIIITADDENDAIRTAKLYARILNSNEYHITSSKMVDCISVEELLEIDGFEDKHGIVFIRNFNEFKIEKSDDKSILANLKKMATDPLYDLVFVLYNKLDSNEFKIQLQSFGIDNIFEFDFDLKNHNIESCKRLISYMCKQSGIDLSLKQLSDLGSVVLGKNTLNEAINEINKGVKNPESIKGDTGLTDEEKFEKIQQTEDSLKEAKNKVSTDCRERNVLLLPMSTLNDVIMSKYTTELFKNVDDTHEGYYISQLEPVPKLLANLLNKQGDKLDTIYVLNTKQTEETPLKDENLKLLKKYTNTKDIVDKNGNKYTAFSYFKERCERFVDSIKSVSLTNGVEDALYNVTNRLKETLNDPNIEKINLYVDIHGGFRIAANVLNAILMLIKDIDNIELKDVYTMEYNKGSKIGTLKSIGVESYVFDFVGGMQEFLSFGRSKGLVRFNKNVPNEKENGLVEAINNISNSILLNQMDNFSVNLKELSNTLEVNRDLKGYYGTVKDLVLNNYKVNINGKIYDLLDKDSDYLPAQLQWCLDKYLLQQALVLVETKTASQLKNSKIIELEAWRKKEFPTEDEDGLCANQFVNFINKSLFSDRKGWMNYKGQEIPNKELISVYFKRIDSNQTQIFTNEEKVIKNIRKHKNQKVNPEKYYCYYGNPKNWRDKKNKWHGIEERNEALRNKILGSNYSKCDKIEYKGSPYIEQDLFVREKLRNDPDFLEQFYRVCYVYKVLKLIRNDTVHSLGRYTNTSEDIANWVRFYLEQLEELIQKAKNIR